MTWRNNKVHREWRMAIYVYNALSEPPSALFRPTLILLTSFLLRTSDRLLLTRIPILFAFAPITLYFSTDYK